jgi:drug/metabolite transporter (DMT)-like permease
VISKGYAAVLGAAILWGLLPIIGRGLYAGGVDPLTAAAFRASLAALAFLLVSLLFKRSSLRIRTKDIPFFVLYGLFCVVGMYCFYFLAIQAIPVAAAAVLLYTAPSSVVVLSAICFKERLTPMRFLSLCMTFIGCVLVVGAYDPANLPFSVPGILFGLGAGISYAMLSIFGKIGLNRYSPWTNMTYTLVFGTLLIWFIRPPWVLLAAAYTPAHWRGFLALALLCTVLPNTMYVSGLKGIEAGQASITATLEPVVAALASYHAFQEALGIPQILGMVMVLSAVVVPILNKSRKIRKNSLDMETVV